LGKINVNKKPRPNLTVASEITCAGYDWMPTTQDTNWKNDLKALIKNESVLHIDDLIYRRTSIGDNPDRVRALTEDIAGLFEWDEQRKQLEKTILVSKGTLVDEH
jgi:glycerol-3-phosphate dehydrogenase